VTYLVDTDWVIDHLNGDQAATNLLSSLVPQGIAISIITYFVSTTGGAPLSKIKLYIESQKRSER
jgi:hypothetical protein